MRKILIKKELNEMYFEKGYAKFPLLNSEQVREIKSFYHENASHQKNDQVAVHATSNTNDFELIQKVSNFLMDNYFIPELSKYLCNYELVLANYLVKESGPNSASPAHQDWLLVDESKHTSFNCWVCLEDANYKTGNLQFIPGSHLFQDCIRSTNTPRFFDYGKNRVSDFLVDLPTKAGECVIFSHGVIHASRKNRSGQPRIAIVVGGYSSGAELLFYHRDNPEAAKVEKYLINKDVLINMVDGSRPVGGQLLSMEPLDVQYLNDKEFNRLCNAQVGLTTVIKNKLLNLFLN